jgi:hypothetical protein
MPLNKNPAGVLDNWDLDDVGAVVLRAVDHDAIFAGHRRSAVFC